MSQESITDNLSETGLDYISSTKKWQKETDDESGQVEQKISQELLSALQMCNLIVLSGCGTSISVGGPPMSDLWDSCMDSQKNEIAQSERLEYCKETSENNIERFLSLCEACFECESLDIEKKKIELCIQSCRKVIHRKCSGFLQTGEDFLKDNNYDSTTSDLNKKLQAHRSLLSKLTRRRIRDPRLKIFTTNYDLCFEVAAAGLGLVVIDGFSFSYPHIFDSRYFEYDMVKRANSSDEQGNYLDGVFHLYKLHGSVNWYSQDRWIEKRELRNIEYDENSSPCMIYPAKGKFQQSYAQPYIETISRFMAALREPNTCLLIIGFGFNDDHLAEPILAAVESNPHLKIVVVDNNAKKNYSSKPKNGNSFRKSLAGLVRNGLCDIVLIHADFNKFTEIIPNLKALSSGEKIENAIREITRNR